MTKAEEFAALLPKIKEDKVKFPLAIEPMEAWCYDNRDLIARALRRDAALENPCDDLMCRVGRCDISRDPHSEGQRSVGKVALAIFREAVQ